MKNVQGYKVDYLVLVGKLKCCMEIMAYFCNSPESVSEVTDRSRYEEFNERMRRLFEEVNEDTIYNYLIKILIRKYGSGSIKYVLGSEKSKWITPNRIIGDDLVSNGMTFFYLVKFELSIYPSRFLIYSNRTNILKR